MPASIPDAHRLTSGLGGRATRSARVEDLGGVHALVQDSSRRKASCWLAVSWTGAAASAAAAGRWCTRRRQFLKVLASAARWTGVEATRRPRALAARRTISTWRCQSLPIDAAIDVPSTSFVSFKLEEIAKNHDSVRTRPTGSCFEPLMMSKEVVSKCPGEPGHHHGLAPALYFGHLLAHAETDRPPTSTPGRLQFVRPLTTRTVKKCRLSPATAWKDYAEHARPTPRYEGLHFKLFVRRRRPPAGMSAWLILPPASSSFPAGQRQPARHPRVLVHEGPGPPALVLAWATAAMVVSSWWLLSSSRPRSVAHPSSVLSRYCSHRLDRLAYETAVFPRRRRPPILSRAFVQSIRGRTVARAGLVAALESA